MKIQKVWIIGSGLMGSGIAQVCAQAQMEVFLTDLSQEILEIALKSIAWSVGKLVEKGNLQEDLQTIIGRIKTGTDPTKVPPVDLAIEAVFEKLDLKQEVFRQLDEFCQGETILATNTSSIPITEIAAVTKRPEEGSWTPFFHPCAHDGSGGGAQRNEDL